LGYYRRASYLVEGARQLADPNAAFPRTQRDWLRVKGVGRYTASAIASICFGERVPVVDGNVVRVLSRFCAIDDDPRRAATEAAYWRLAGAIVDATCDRPGDANQALMELGATVCGPKAARPKCEACPWRACGCRVAGDDELSPADYPPTKKSASSAATGSVAGPKKRKDAATPSTANGVARRDLAVCVVQDDAGRYALVRRDARDSVLGTDRMWHLPSADDRAALAGAVARACLTEMTRLDPTRLTRCTEHDAPLRHSITTTRYAIHVDYLRVAAGEARLPGGVDSDGTEEDDDDVVWLAEADLATKGSSSIVAKAIQCAKKRNSASS